MLHPDNWSPDYTKNLEQLKKEGFRAPKQSELPEHLQHFCGAETFLVNDKGDIKSVSQASGQVNDVSRTPPIKENADNVKRRADWFKKRHGGPGA